MIAKNLNNNFNTVISKLTMSNPQFEPLLQDQELVKAEPTKIEFKDLEKQKPLQFLNYLVDHISQVLTILLIIYFVFLIINLLSCKHLFLPNHLALDSKSTNFINQLKVNLISPGQIADKPTQKLNNLKHQNDEKGSANQQQYLDPAENLLTVSENPSNQENDELQTAQPLYQSEPQSKQKSKESKNSNLALQKNNQQKNGNQINDQKQDQFAQSNISKKTSEKYQYLLNKFQTKTHSTTLEDHQIKRQLLKSEKKIISTLPLAQRQTVIKNYIDETQDLKSIFLLQSSQNEILNKHNTKLGSKLKSRLQDIYNLNNYEQVNRFCVVVNTFNNAQQNQISRTLNSIYNQNYQNYHVVVVDRQSTDSTLQIVNHISQKPQLSKITKVVQGKQSSEIQANFEGLKYCKKGDIAILLNGNSQILTKEAFRLTDSTYQTQKSQILYSDAYDLDLSKKQVKLTKASEYDESQIFMNLFRDISRRYGKFITFNTELLNSIGEGFLINANEQWFKYSHNEALILSLLQASCSKISHLKEPLVLSQFDSSQALAVAESLKHQIKEISRKNKVNIC